MKVNRVVYYIVSIFPLFIAVCESGSGIRMFMMKVLIKLIKWELTVTVS